MYLSIEMILTEVLASYMWLKSEQNNVTLKIAIQQIFLIEKV